MSKIMYGCQTYPWKMNYDRYAGQIPHIAKTAADAGFKGLEAEICMLGEFFDKPDLLKEILNSNGLTLAAIVLHQDWNHKKETEEERNLTIKTIEFVKNFPWAKIVVSHHAGLQERKEGLELRERRENLLSCMNSVAIRAAENGIVTCYHPNSAKNSLFRTEEDYKILFDMLSKSNVGYAPDIGHIVNGGMDPIKILEESRDIIRHVHFKDRSDDGKWAVMGEGSIDYKSITQFLINKEYEGWIMVEDESPRAETDSDGVVRDDGVYIKNFMHE